MTIDRKKIRWNGWGWVDGPDPIGDRADAVWDWLGNRLGLHPLPETPAKKLDEIELPKIALGDAQLGKLRDLTAADRVMTDDYERAFHARGKGYFDLVALRAGHLDTAPDAVVYPETADEILALLQYCDAESIALIPYGGGSSVVGGVTALKSSNQCAAVTLDVSLMDKVLDIDEEAHLARIQAGVYGPHLEQQLGERGFTLGHYPQSFEFSTLGGWIAHRGAGQQSNKFGKAEKWFVGATLATPGGFWTTESFPASAVGPQLNSLIVGSEGTLGIITEATVKIQKAPECKDYRGYLFHQFDQGAKAIREIVQEGVPTAMLRLSDADEAFFFTVMRTIGKDPEPKVRFCIMIVGVEASKAEVERSVERTRAIVERNDGVHMGERLGEGWYEGRFAGPYIRDPMLDRGLVVETLETSTAWSNLLNLHEVMTKTLEDAIGANAISPEAKSIVMAHVSHAYVDGASLYFTFLFPRDLDRPAEQFGAIKHTACEALLANGGTISHHHGVGTDHAPYLEREKGPVGTAVLRSIRTQIDPKGTLNPGKLLA